MKVQRVVVVTGGAHATSVTDEGAHDVPLRELLRLDDLAADLGRLLDATGSVTDEEPPPPGAGTLVVGAIGVLDGLAASGADMRWVVGLRLQRLRAVRDAATFGLAAGVAADDLWDWVQDGRGAAVYGRADVALARPAVVATDLADTFGEYARITMPGVTDLPTALAEYLRAA
ncbi:hypothetical protein CTKZ_05710 [Cellulomonas algicola]|uniref:Uncharacterized protein n=1 Tax=Cellulomonas algicola TaxID=2071633 RepID=A0A401UWF2_9CELL|nr:hypothetical protein [Cellulomonas algicola]GCD19009.1 hypothetical protein CTKZ_05710 [Cellulomonas algicola]